MHEVEGRFDVVRLANVADPGLVEGLRANGGNIFR
jgi:hypothetical protein